MNVGGQVDGGRELSHVEQKDPLLGRLVRRLLDGVNTLAKNTATSATGENAPPPPLAKVNVSVSPTGEAMHVTLDHPGTVDKNSHYIVEVHTDPTFGTPIIIKDAGASRSLEPFHLPTKSADGSVTHNYYVRAYPQNPGSQPAQITNGGGPFTMNGSTQLDFSPPRGSGTGPNSGQGGQGLGRVQQRQ